MWTAAIVMAHQSRSVAKEHREGGENRANYIDHKSAVTRCSDCVSRIWAAVQPNPLISHIDWVHAAMRSGYRAAAKGMER
jgi:hypothetical protein